MPTCTLFTDLLTSRSRFLLEKLTGSHLVKKFPAFYGTRRLIIAFTSARHLSLSWASSIQSIPLHPTFWRPILILSSYLRLGLPSGLFPSGVPHQNPVYASPLSHTRYMPRPSNSSRFYHRNNTGWIVHIIKLLNAHLYVPHRKQCVFITRTSWLKRSWWFREPQWAK